MEAFRDREIERLVRELAEAWIGDPADGAGVVERISIVPHPANASSSSRDDGVGAAPIGQTDGNSVLSLISVSALRQPFPSEYGADSSLGRELAHRTR
ncbi:MAG: hypothetical protein IIB17_04085 [Chloroflexi bacterium]|nr:hypothetical protein [Chloroflexota bacterium]